MERRKDIFKKVIIVTYGKGKPIFIKNRLFGSDTSIRGIDGALRDAIRASGDKEDNLRTRTFFLVSEEDAKKLRVIKEKN